MDLKVGADVTKADKELTHFQGTAKSVKITAPFELDTNPAKTTLVEFQSTASSPTKSIHTATLDNNIFMTIAKLKQPTSSTHTIYVNTVQKHAVGGFIRRQGQLGGYGGGDRVKALLRRW